MMTTHDDDEAPAAPDGLGPRGIEFWDALQSENVFDAASTARLHEACRVLDRLEDLSDVIADEGVMSTGSTGQPVVHPAVAEARQLAGVLDRLIDSLALPPTEEEAAENERWKTQRAKAGAAARWGVMPGGRRPA